MQNQTIDNKGKISFKKKITIAVILILIAIALAFALYISNAFSKINRKEIDKAQLSTVDLEGITNILLLGVDSRDMSDSSGSRTDAIMILSINNKANTATLTSIYRDTFLEMGKTGLYDKITHAHAFGGPEMTITSINRSMDLNIDQYVLMNFKGVADAIDAMGGIQIKVEDYEIDELNRFIHDTAIDLGIEEYNYIEAPGVHDLNGLQSVAYGRIRHGVGDDFKRTARMREVVTAAAKKAHTLKKSELFSVIKSLISEIETNMTNTEMISLATKMSGIEIDTGLGFPYQKKTGYKDGVSYVFAINLKEDVIAFHNNVLHESEYIPGPIVDEISAAAKEN